MTPRLFRSSLGVVLLLGIVALPLSAWADADCTGTAATRQSVTAFSALLDGQPGTASQPQVTTSAGISQGSGQVQLGYAFTPGARQFACDMLLSVNLPTLEFADSKGRFDRSFGLSWEQRWRADDAYGPTLSTFLALQVPFDSPGSHPQLSLAGVVARSFKPGTFYVNLTTASQNGVRSWGWQTTTLVGWRHDLRDGRSLVLDAGVQSGGGWLVEAALQIPVGASLTIGPGFSWADGNGRSAATFGVVLQRTFSLGPPKQ